MLVNEPLASQRTITVVLTDMVGVPLPGISFSAGDVKIQKYGGSFTNITTLPTEVTGAADGIYNITFTQGEVDTVGPLIVSIVKTGVADFVTSVSVDPLPVADLDPSDLTDIATSVASQINASITLSAAAITAIWDHVIEDTYSARDYMRGMASVLIWKFSGALGRNPIFKAANGIKNRIVATITPDARTAVVFDPED